MCYFQKVQIQERAVNEVKNAIKPYYQKKDITKDEYKEIVRKAVEKVCLIAFFKPTGYFIYHLIYLFNHTVVCFSVCTLLL